MLRKMLRRGTGVAIVAAACALGSGAKADEDFNVTLAGASAGGFWSTISAALNSALQATYPDSTVTHLTSGGGFANLGLIDKGQVPMGIAYDVEARIAKEGAEPFRAPVEAYSLIQVFAGGPAQIFLRRDLAEELGVDSSDDLKDLDVELNYANNRRGNVGSMLCDTLMAASGVPAESIEEKGGQLIYAASREQISLWADGRIDLSCLVGIERYSAFLEMQRAREFVLLKIPDEAIDKVLEDFGGVDYTIAANTYEGQDEAVRSVGMAIGVVASPDLDEEIAYKLVKAWIENVDKLASVHRILAGTTPESLARFGPYPYHPGAIRAFKEAGVM